MQDSRNLPIRVNTSSSNPGHLCPVCYDVKAEGFNTETVLWEIKKKMKYIYYGQTGPINRCKIKTCIKICPSNYEVGDEAKQNENMLCRVSKLNCKNDTEWTS